MKKGKKKAIIISIVCCLAIVAAGFILTKTNVVASSPFSKEVEKMAFDNILEHTGYYTVHAIVVNGKIMDDWREYVFYAEDGDASEVIAYCCGYERPVSVDIDNDGSCELICNNEARDGSEKTLYIYKNKDGRILQGKVDLETCKSMGHGGLENADGNVETYLDLMLWNINVTYVGSKSGHKCGFSLKDFNVITYDAWNGTGIQCE